MKTQIILTLLLLELSVICLATPVAAVETIQPVSHTSYVDHLGYYHVVGEIENIGDQALSMIEVTATLYNSDNDVIATRKASTMLEVLFVNRKAPFDIQLLDELLSEDVDHYNLDVTFLAANALNAGLEILSHTAYIDEEGFHISGEIKNIATEKARNVRVIATY